MRVSSTSLSNAASSGGRKLTRLGLYIARFLMLRIMARNFSYPYRSLLDLLKERLHKIKKGTETRFASETFFMAFH